MPSQFVCLNAMPGIGCGFPENIGLGAIYIVSAILCLYFLIKLCLHKKEQKTTDLIEQQIQVYWISAMFWLLYRGVLFIVPFNYNLKTFLLFHNGFNEILFLIPFALLILILCEILYLLSNPGKSVTMLRIILYFFLTVFLIIVIFLSIFVEETDQNNQTEGAESPLYLWTSCTNLIALLFITIPAVQLIRNYSFPFPQEEDKNCIRTSYAGVVIFSIRYTYRIVYNCLQYFKINPISKIYEKSVFSDNGANIGIRIYGFCFYLFLDIVVIWMANATILNIYYRNLSSSRDQYYIA